MTADRSSVQGELDIPIIIVLSLFNILFGIFGAAGNVLVCFTIWKNSFLQAGVNFCIVSLSIADLLVCLFTQPVYVLSLSGYTEKHFRLFYFVVTSTSLYASLNSLLLLTANRAIAVLYPLRYKSILRTRNITCSIIMAWVLSLIEGVLRTFTSFKLATPHIRIAAVIVFVAMYAKIFVIVRRQRRQVISQAKSLAFNHKLAAMVSENSATKTAALIVGSFVISFLPITILLLVGSSNKLAVEVCFTIMCCSSSINPIVYALRSERFRVAVINLLPSWRIVPSTIPAIIKPPDLVTQQTEECKVCHPCYQGNCSSVPNI